MYLSIYPSTQASLSHKLYCVSIIFQLDPRNNTNKKYRLFPSQNSQSGYSYSVAQVCLTLCDPMDCSSQASLSFTAFGICSNSCLLGQWCHQTISSSVTPFSSCLQSFPLSGLFSNESALCIRWPKYWSFSLSMSPSNEYSGLISFRMG